MKSNVTNPSDKKQKKEMIQKSNLNEKQREKQYEPINNKDNQLKKLLQQIR